MHLLEMHGACVPVVWIWPHVVAVSIFSNSSSGSHCAGLFSTMVLGGSSSAPNLQDYARAHRKKLTSSAFLDGMCKHAHIFWKKKDEPLSFCQGTLTLSFLCLLIGSTLLPYMVLILPFCGSTCSSSKA